MTTLQLSDSQKAYVKVLANELEPSKRATFLGALEFRIGGRPGDETLKRVASLVYKELMRGELLRRA